MDHESLRGHANNIQDRAKQIAGIALCGSATIGGGVVAGYQGYRFGRLIAPDGNGILNKAAHYAIETVPTLALGAVGAAVGAFVSIWILDGGLTEFLEGQ
jgi:hypothetical protein